LFHQEVTFLLSFVTLIGVYSRIRAADEATAALNNCHSSSAFAVHCGSTRNKDDTLSVICNCPPGPPNLFGKASDSSTFM